MNPFPYRAGGNPAPSYCPTSLGLASWLSTEFSYLPLAFTHLWTHGPSRTPDLCLCTGFYSWEVKGMLGFHPPLSVGKQNSRDGPHLCNKHTLSCCTPALWKSLMDHISTNPSKQAELHHWRACQGHVTQV